MSENVTEHLLMIFINLPLTAQSKYCVVPELSSSVKGRATPDYNTLEVNCDRG